MFRPIRFKLATALILALLLTAALAVPVAATNHDVPPPPLNPADPDPDPGPTNPPPANGGGTLPPTPGGGGGSGGGSNGGTPTPGGGGGNGGGGMMAPSWPPANMIVTHAATQVQLAPAHDGLQAYFIGPDGGHSGPWIEPFARLAAKHPAGGAVTLYTGSNPGTGKPVTIYYLASEKKVRVSTYYPDTQYDVNKPYVFTVDAGHNVVHDQW